MSRPTSRPFATITFPPSSPPRRGRGWWIVLALTIALLAIDSGTRLSVLRQLNTAAEGGAPLVRQADSPTGYAGGQRDLLLSDTGLDGYQWIMQTQQMLAGGGARIRHVAYDNSPEGRAVHWASPFRWWLATTAWGWHAATGDPMPLAVERVAPWAGTLLLLPLLLIAVPLVARRWGGGAASVLALGLVMVFPVYEQFAVGSTDHHGLAVGLGLLSVLLVALGGGGLVRSVGLDTKFFQLDARAARRYFVAAGIAGAVGLWISAPTQLPVLAALGLGAVVTGWLARGEEMPTDARFDPTLWRAWGLAGGLASLAFYLLEYFPGDFALRLEVNHPLYAVAWWGGGEALCALCRSLVRHPMVAVPTDRWRVPLGFAALLVLPIVFLVAGDQVFLVSDPFLWALHSDYILEFASLGRQLRALSPAEAIVGLGLAPLAVLPLGWLVFRRDVPVAQRGMLALVLVPGVVTFLLALTQVRWLGVSSAIWLVGLAAAAGVIASRPAAFRFSAGLLCTALALVIFVPHGWKLIDSAVAARRGQIGQSDRDLRRVVARDIAHWLRDRLGDKPGLVLSGPGSTSSLIYHGGLNGLGTLYWENRAGLKAAADIFAARTADEAYALIARRGITHLVLFSWDGFADAYVRLARGLRAEQPAPTDTFIALLRKPECPPPWLRLVPYPVPDHPALRGQSILIFEVVAEQTPAEAQVRYAQALLAQGEMERATAAIQAALQLDPRSVPALVALAQLQLAQQQSAPLAQTFARIQSSMTDVRALDVSDCVGLAMLYDMFGDNARARQVFTAMLGQVDGPGLRRLPPDVLFRFVGVAHQLGLAASHPEIVQAAERLLPPDALQAIRGQSAPRAP